MTSPYRIERDRGTKEARQQLAVLREKWPDYDRPLAVQIAALLHVAGVDAAEGRRGMASLLDKILGLEYEHWNEALNLFSLCRLD